MYEKSKRIIIRPETYYKEVANRLNLYPEDIEQIAQCMEASLTDFLTLAEEGKTVHIDFTPNISFTSKYRPNKVVRDLHKDISITDDTLEFGCKFSPAYRFKWYQDFKQRQLLKSLMDELKEDKELKE